MLKDLRQRLGGWSTNHPWKIDRAAYAMGEIAAVINKLGIEQAQALAIESKIIEQLYENVATPAMPVQDAIDLAR
jgi:hypothetical protein